MPLQPPKIRGTETATYRATPHPKPFFKTVLDGKRMFQGARTTVTTKLAAPTLEIVSVHETPVGRIDEVATLDVQNGVAMHFLDRIQKDTAGKIVREEKIDFSSTAVLLPERTFPEVLLPFVLRGHTLEARDFVYSWSVDRFVARVYFEVKRSASITVPAGTFRTHEVVMYPDLNDWVPLGSMLTTLAKPLLPKYHMWFEEAAPHRVIRFEGAYGPPGAPELILELESSTTA
ncbi:MAG: hypothetical protein U0234_17805 [Sandaracinus sp.]